MATWNETAKGTQARKVIELPLGRPAAPRLGPDGKVILGGGDHVVRVGLRPLTSGEVTDAHRRAREEAVAAGIADPRDGQDIYDRARMEHTIALACVDPDVPEDQPSVPFFESVAQIRKERALGDERVAYLYTQWKLWQLEHSPDLRKVTPEEFVVGLGVLGGSDEEAGRDFFASQGPGLQWIYVRSLALQWCASLTPSSASTSASASSTTSERKPSEPPKKADGKQRRG